MTGHVRRRGARSWELKYDVGRDAGGRRITRYAAFKGTKREAEVELAKKVAAAANGEDIDPSRITVEHFLDRWDRQWCATSVGPKTRERYNELLRLHVRPTLGGVRLQRLRAGQLSELYAALSARLKPRTVGHVHRVLHGALERAVDWGIVPNNVAARITPPKVEHQELVILTAAQVKKVLELAAGKSIRPLAALALASGLRRGELLALRWKDLDLDAHRLTVARSLEQTKAGLRFKTPKTAHGRRTISIPASTVAEMRAHWTDQQQTRLALGAGKAPPEALVFCDVNGEPRRPNAVTKEWERAATVAGVGFASLHSLRHTHASHLIAAGVDILTISRRLGHASPTITLSVYGHLMPNTDDRAAQVMEAALRTE